MKKKVAGAARLYLVQVDHVTRMRRASKNFLLVQLKPRVCVEKRRILLLFGYSSLWEGTVGASHSQDEQTFPFSYLGCHVM